MPTPEPTEAPQQPPAKPRARFGPAPKELPANAHELVGAMAADGWSKAGIARQLGVSMKTFDKRLEDDPELQRAFDVGRDLEHQALFNVLYRQAVERGNATAAMFLLKSRHGYREGDQSEIANRVSITFNLPGADKLEAVIGSAKKPKVIDHE